MTHIVGGFASLSFNEGGFNARGGTLRTSVAEAEPTVAPAVTAGDADAAVDTIWLKPEPVIYIPPDCGEP